MHDRDSPTIRDVLDVLDILDAMSDDPSEFVVRADAERDKLREDALWLLDQLRPFADGGQFENLGRSSEFDIRRKETEGMDADIDEDELNERLTLFFEHDRLIRQVEQATANSRAISRI